MSFNDAYILNHRRRAMSQGGMEIIMGLRQILQRGVAIGHSSLVEGVVLVACAAKVALYLASTRHIVGAQAVEAADIGLQGIFWTTLLIMAWKAVRTVAADVRGAWVVS
jgi:hypothetical protein